MRKLRFIDAIREAIRQELEEKSNLFLIGEDVRIGGGFGVSKGLVELFGKKRIIDTPISEIGFTGLAVGAAMGGLIPIVEYQFGDFVFCAMDQIVNQAAKLRFLSGGQVKVPIVFRLPVGANRRGAHHAQCSESIFMNVAGLKIITPSFPYDAKGLLINALNDGCPILFFEHKLLYPTDGSGFDEKVNIKLDVPEKPYSVPFGKAIVRKEGADVTIVATMLMLHRSLKAAIELENEGISVEIIDPRTIIPLDKETILQSVAKTKRLVTVEECQSIGGWGNEIISDMVEDAGYEIKVRRVASMPIPIPYAPILENKTIPDIEKIKRSVKEILR